MSANTSIEWTDRTWNPVRGCALVSEGCRNCYAMKVAHRFAGQGGPYEGLTEIGPSGPRWNGQIRTVEDALRAPLRCRKPQRIFVNSMSDLFHESVPYEFIDRVFAVMSLAERHTFQILTKRPQRMCDYVKSRPRDTAKPDQAVIHTEVKDSDLHYSVPWPLPNVALGVSCESPRERHRIMWLLDTPAALRFVSMEPLLEDVDLGDIEVVVEEGNRPRVSVDALTGHVKGPDEYLRQRLDWVIVGGESGPNARRCNVRWVRSIVRQCKRARVPVFVKQLGAIVIDRNDAGFLGEEPHHWPDIIDQEDRIEHDLDGTRDGYQGAPVRIHLRDRKGGDPAEWPRDLRVRQFPTMQREAVSA